MTEAPLIQRLDETVVNRIAAGEVVQRPANALKELLENCLDAKSTQISVTVKQGGLKLLQIQDNGTGIRKTDLGIVCERFTTSKLQKFGDLQGISTYGFRGEALASISHVAHLTIITRTSGEKCSWKCSYVDGKPTGPAKPCAGNQGTQITVEDLFYNVTTRRKALRAPAEEHSKIAEVVSRYAIHNASVGFSLKKQGDGSVDLRTPSHSDALANIRIIYGGLLAKELLEMSCDNPRLQFKCRGLVSNANHSSKRCTMLLFINNRLVESAALRKAVDSVYSCYLPKNAHPFTYLSLDINPRNVDVNVHPTKHEVSFLHEDAIVEAVQAALEAKLLGCNASRTFYTQSLLPGAAAASSSSSATDSSQTRTYDHSLVRTDDKHQKLTKYLSSTPNDRSLRETDVIDEPSDKKENASAEKQLISANRRELQLTSVSNLLREVSKDCHSELRDVLRHHTFVGIVDDRMALLQHATHLYLARTQPLCEQMFYQLLLKDFGNIGLLKLSPPASLQSLALLALDMPDSGWSEADGSKMQLADYIVSFLTAKASMLADYFSMTIDSSGNICTLPYLLDDFVPVMSGLPLYILRLTTEVNWSSEQECFNTFAVETAKFYASPPLPGEEGEKVVAGGSWRWQVEQILYPALKQHIEPPRHLAKDTTLLQLADLHQLYKVFERC